MMRLHLHASLLALALAGSGPGWADETMPSARFLEDLLPTTVQVVSESLSVEEGRATSAYVTMSSPLTASAARGVSVTETPEGGLVLGIDAITVTPNLETAPKVSASGLVVKLSGLPIYGTDDLCAWIDRIESLKIDGLKWERPSGQGRTIADAYDLRFEATDTGGCQLDGIASAGSMAINFAGGQTTKVMDIRSRISLPASAAAAEARRDLAALDVSLAATEFSRRREIPSFGTSGSTLSVKAESASLSGLVAVLRASNPFAVSRDPNFLVMQLANASTMVRAEAGLGLPVIRVYAAGAVPARSVANFSRAGLSTISGGARLALTMREGDLLSQGIIDARGLGEIRAAIEVALYPYTREKLDLAAAGHDLGFHMLPDLEIRTASLALKDSGFSRAFEGIAGTTTGVYLDDQAARSVSEGGQALAAALSRAAQFARQLASGTGLEAQVKPAAPVPLIDVIIGALKDPVALTHVLGATVNPLYAR